jgi:hypothetical protein
MINKIKIRKSLKKKPGRCRNKNFKIIFETEKRLVIPYDTLNYLISIDFDSCIDYKIMVINIINERKEWFCLEETDISSLKYVIEE